VEIERISAAVRPRSAWEAVDLGFSLARAWWPQVLGAWLILVLPCALALNLIFWDAPWLAAIAIWWLKPLFDRAPLAVVSRRLFGEQVGPVGLLTRFPRLVGPGIIAALTWRRASPWRSFTMPIDQLERLRGRERRARVGLLLREHAGAGAGLTLFCSTCEACLVIGFFAFFTLLFSEPLGLDLTSMLTDEEAPAWFVYAGNALQLAAMTLLEPFFVVGGFALYLNRRVELEGWDIDLAFRRLANRLERRRARGASLVAAAILLGLGLALPSLLHADQVGEPQAVVAALSEPPVEAAVGTSAAQQASGFRTNIEEVLAGPEFGEKEQLWTWQLKDQKPQESEPSDMDLELIAVIGKILARLLTWLVVAVAAAFLIYVAIAMVRRASGHLPRGGKSRPSAPEILFGLDLRPESLPDDILAAAHAAFAAGQFREALSLLYRGALSHLVRQREVEIPESATEGECVGLVQRQVDAALADDFALLVRAWLECAYGHRSPPADRFASLCERWRPHLGEGA